MNSASYQYMVNGVMSDAEDNIEVKPELEELLRMDDNTQVMFFKVMWKTIGNVIKSIVLDRGSFIIPYIGRLVIKTKNKFAIEFKQEIAKDFGYINWSDIPKDKLKEAKEILKSKLYNKVIEYNKTTKVKKEPKILKFKINKKNT